MSIKIEQSVNIGTDWIEEIKVKLDSTFVNENTMVFSDSLGKGYFYFKEIIPGMMAQIIDLTSSQEIEFTRLPSEEELYILYYDISEESFSRDMQDVSENKYEADPVYGFGIIPSHVVTRYISIPFQRRFSVAITLTKSLFEEYLGGPISKSIKNKNFDLKKSVYHFKHIDSRTKVLLLKLQDMNFEDSSFRFSVKGNILQILGYSIKRLRAEDNVFSNNLRAFEYDKIVQSRDYLMERLCEPFPSIKFLADMAGMSISRYIIMFKKIHFDAPKQFFIRERLVLAKKMLQSGGYKDMKSIIYDIGFSSIINFNRLYFLRYGVLPKNHFNKFK